MRFFEKRGNTRFARLAARTPSVRLLLGFLTLTLSLTVVANASANDGLAEPPAGPPPASTSTVPKRIVFPVVGSVWFFDDFGAAREQGGHEGNDILAKWRAPVVATEAGHITIWTASERAGCMLYLYGDSGTTYVYVHLNNDLTRHNDNEGGCVNGVAYAPGLADAQTVRAGQLLGFVGDSGDAAGGAMHLHFEIIPNDDESVSPFRWLKRAYRPLFAQRNDHVDPALPVSLRLQGRVRAIRNDGPTSRLVLNARVVRMEDGKRTRVKRRVVVTIPADAVVRRKTASARKSLALRKVAPGNRVVLWTAPSEPLTAQLARPSSLVAARLLVRR